MIRKLNNGPAEVDVISLVGMPRLGKTTLAYRVYNDKSIIDHFVFVLGDEEEVVKVIQLSYDHVSDYVNPCLVYLGITLPVSLLNEIGMLVHLKYLIIQTNAKDLPPSFSNLCNLEILVVNNLERSCMVLSPCFWKKCFPMLEKLDISRCYELMDIPDSFGDIASLKFINVPYNPQFIESIFSIKEYVEEMTGEDKLELAWGVEDDQCFEGDNHHMSCSQIVFLWGCTQQDLRLEVT
uniref:NB-ARC domain-containing protein n=1 Tax=Solanum lycopersicum TaxID=4081 RepID=K4CU35_SOLLC